MPARHKPDTVGSHRRNGMHHNIIRDHWIDVQRIGLTIAVKRMDDIIFYFPRRMIVKGHSDICFGRPVIGIQEIYLAGRRVHDPGDHDMQRVAEFFLAGGIEVDADTVERFFKVGPDTNNKWPEGDTRFLERV